MQSNIDWGYLVVKNDDICYVFVCDWIISSLGNDLFIHIGTGYLLHPPLHYNSHKYHHKNAIDCPMNFFLLYNKMR